MRIWVFTVAVALVSPAVAAPLTIDLRPAQGAIDFYLVDDGAPLLPEDMMATMQCGDAEAAARPGSLQVTILSDDRNASAARMLLFANPLSTSVASFKAGTARVTAQFLGVDMSLDELNGGWDMTVSLGAVDLPKTLSASVGKGSLALVIGNYSFDMTPRQEDRAKLIAFLSSCGVKPANA